MEILVLLVLGLAAVSLAQFVYQFLFLTKNYFFNYNTTLLELMVNKHHCYVEIHNS